MVSIKKKYKYSLSVAATVSVVFHLLFLIFLKTNNSTGKNSFLEREKLKITKTNNIEFIKIKKITQKELRALKRQIVAIDKNGKNEINSQAKYSGELNQSFDRQTVAKNAEKFNEAGVGSKSGILTSNISSDKKSTHKKSSKLLSLKDLGGVGIAINVAQEQDQVKKDSIDNALGNEKGSKQSRGLASTSDYVEDVALGDVTNMNTVENKYYGFYHRIRQKLEQYWGSTIHERAKSLYKKGRRIPASENLITAIIVVLNDKGNIVDIKIEGTSGIKELDQAAVESFNKAGPFPNPPKGLLVEGRAIIQWGFVVKS